MATQTLRIGPSYPSTNLMPSPNRWQRKPVKRAHSNETASGNTYTHFFALRQLWQGEWLGVTNTDMTTIMTELNRQSKLALIDFDLSSYTVQAEPESVTLEMVPGTNPPEWNIQVTFKQVA